MNKAFFIAILIFFGLQLFSQVEESDFERFKREREEGMQKKRDKFEKYKEERDKDFAEFLQREWKNFELFKSGEPISYPGPEKIPLYSQELSPELEKIQIPILEIEPIEPKPKPTAVIDFTPQTLLAKTVSDELLVTKELVFYGTELDFKVPIEFSSINLSSVTENGVSEFWSNISETQYYVLIEKLLEYKSLLYLNDFALLMMIESLSKEISESENEAKLITWFILNKAGYNSRIGFSGEDVYLLIPVINQLYGLPFYTFDNINYYIFEDEVTNIRTYQGDYPSASRLFNFDIRRTPLFSEKIASRTIEFEYDWELYNFELEYNLNHIDFYSDYPQGEIKIFFDAGMSVVAHNSLIEALDSLVYNMDETYAAEFLLRFVQTAFDYQTDHEQFGYEKYFFPEEVLHYPYSDCEDRAVLYAYLVKEFLQLPVIGLNFPGHIATAVKFNDDVEGAYFNFNGEKYLVCDPTYINAPIGAIMPEFSESKVRLIGLNNSGYEYMKYANIWESLNQKGIYPYTSNNNIVKVEEGLFYAIGFIGDTAMIHNKIYEPTNDQTLIMIVATDDSGNIAEYQTISSEGAGFVYGLQVINDILFINGFYSSEISVTPHRLDTEANKKTFIASFDLSLKPLWIKNTTVTHDDVNETVYYSIVANQYGEVFEINYINEQVYDKMDPVQAYYDDMIVFTGNFEAQHHQLKDSEIYLRKTPFEYASTVENLYDYYLSKFYNNEVAGLFAFFSTMQGGNISVSGRELRATISMINPNFEEQYPRLYRDLGNIRKIESKNNIITIYTSFLSNFKAGPIVISNRAKIRIRNFRSGNMQVYALSGISYRPFIRNYEVNYIKLFRVTNDLLIDFGYSKNQKIVDIGKRILK